MPMTSSLEPTSHPQDHNYGAQPLDTLMITHHLENTDLVNVSLEQLTHKQVQRARKGRQLTLKMMQKVARAFNVALFNKISPEQKEIYNEYIHKHLFTYAKGYNTEAPDINDAIFSHEKKEQ